MQNEPHHKETGFLPMQNKAAQISFAVTAKLISAFVFATQIVQFLYFLNPKFTASNSVLVQLGLCQTWSETQKTGFLVSRLKSDSWKMAFLLYESNKK